jgi:hypothetical protein
MIFVETESNLGLFCGRKPIVGFLLNEASGRFHFKPNRFVNEPVDFWGGIDSIGACGWTSAIIDVDTSVLRAELELECETQKPKGQERRERKGRGRVLDFGKFS